MSEITAQWFQLFNLYALLGTVAGVVVIGLLLFNIVRYRARDGVNDPPDAPTPGRIPPERGRIGAVWILTGLVGGILLTLTFGTINTVNLILTPPRKPAMTVEVHGFQWGWKFIYPNGKETVGELRLPAGTPVLFKVTSDDVFHKFHLIEFKYGVDALPGRFNEVWFSTDMVGTYTIQCFELCGAGHSNMKSRLVIMHPSEFQKWYGGG
jgi:cytochrome c oxidase subunit 2